MSPIIVRFVRRDTKTALMKKKKTLRTIDHHRNTFVNDDLTPPFAGAGEACVDDRRVLPLHCDGRERGGEEEARFSRRPLQTWLVRGEDRELWTLLPLLGKSCSRTSTSTLQSSPNGYLRLDIMDC